MPLDHKPLSLSIPQLARLNQNAVYFDGLLSTIPSDAYFGLSEELREHSSKYSRSKAPEHSHKLKSKAAQRLARFNPELAASIMVPSMMASRAAADTTHMENTLKRSALGVKRARGDEKEEEEEEEEDQEGSGQDVVDSDGNDGDGALAMGKSRDGASLAALRERLKRRIEDMKTSRESKKDRPKGSKPTAAEKRRERKKKRKLEKKQGLGAGGGVAAVDGKGGKVAPTSASPAPLPGKSAPPEAKDKFPGVEKNGAKKNNGNGDSKRAASAAQNQIKSMKKGGAALEKRPAAGGATKPSTATFSESLIPNLDVAFGALSSALPRGMVIDEEVSRPLHEGGSSSSGGGKSKVGTLQKLLKQAKAYQSQMSILKASKDTSKVADLAFSVAMARAEGSSTATSTVTSPAKIKSALKRLEKKKQRSAEAWGERKAQVEEEKESRAASRNENVARKTSRGGNKKDNLSKAASQAAASKKKAAAMEGGGVVEGGKGGKGSGGPSSSGGAGKKRAGFEGAAKRVKV